MAEKVMKRHYDSGDDFSKKKHKLGMVEGFDQWIRSKLIYHTDKVCYEEEMSEKRIKVLATVDLDVDELLFSINREFTLSPETSRIADVLRSDFDDIKGESGWVPLLLALLYEVTTPGSNWEPYLNLIPGSDVSTLPMFWERSARERLLKGTGLVELVESDLENMQKEFNEIVVPFVSRHTDLFSDRCSDFSLYKTLVGFVMSYSFTEPETEDVDDIEVVNKKGPVMIPPCDMLNHTAQNNSKLVWKEKHLEMRTTKPIKEGEEVFNTYGELGNSELLHMYGFTESHTVNIYDTVKIRGATLRSASAKLSCNTEKLVAEKWKWLLKQGIVDESSAIVLDQQAILMEDEASITLKVMCQSADEFKHTCEDDEWMEDDECDLDYGQGLLKLPATQRQLFIRLAELYLSELPVEDDNTNSDVIQLRSGHKYILSKLTSCLISNRC